MVKGALEAYGALEDENLVSPARSTSRRSTTTTSSPSASARSASCAASWATAATRSATELGDWFRAV